MLGSLKHLQHFANDKIPRVLKKEKGVAGLNILIELIAVLFVLGILVMAFVIAGVNLRDSVDDTQAQGVINATYNAIDDVVDWFPTFIVIGCIVVLILLIVIVYRTVKGSGMTGGA